LVDGTGHSWRNPGQIDAAYGFAACTRSGESVAALAMLLHKKNTAGGGGAAAAAAAGDWAEAAAAATALGEMGSLGAAATGELLHAVQHPNE
jgi:hypothetical protein